MKNTASPARTPRKYQSVRETDRRRAAFQKANGAGIKARRLHLLEKNRRRFGIFAEPRGRTFTARVGIVHFSV